MNSIIILLCMIYLHVFDDYFLQGCLANLKQREYWINHPDYKPLYKNDYLMALFMHSFSWSFSISIPILISYLYCGYNIDLTLFLVLFIINIFTHFIVDDMKANIRIINLIQDQLIHIIQIICTYLILYY